MEERSTVAGAEGKVTRLLLEWSGGDAEALEELMPLVYEQLQRLALSLIHI